MNLDLTPFAYFSMTIAAISGLVAVVLTLVHNHQQKRLREQDAAEDSPARQPS